MIRKAVIPDIVMVIGRGKRAIEAHFDRNFELKHADLRADVIAHINYLAAEL